MNHGEDTDGAPDERIPDELLENCAEALAGDGGAAESTQVQKLLALAGGAELFPDGDTPYATMKVRTHRETHPIRSTAYRLLLTGRYYHAHNGAPNAEAMTATLNVLAARAIHGGRQHRVYRRVAEHDGAVYLDLCDDEWRAVKVTAEGWEIMSAQPVKFTRRRGMQALPEPVHGGSIDELRPLINAGDDGTWRLVVGWQIMALHPRGPYPVLVVHGEQGSAKSWLCRFLRRLVDPNESELRSAPRDSRDLMIAAENAWVVALDNMSHLSPELSDDLCRLATGGGFSTRALYTDDEERIFSACRPVMVNGIEELATRSDLLDRAIVLHLPTIPDDRRVDEAQLERRFDAVRPRILGAVLDAVAAALANVKTVRLERPPRMADFARWIMAAEPALPWPGGGFLAAYGDNRQEAVDLAIEAAAIGPAIMAMVREHRSWSGTAQELLAALEDGQHADGRTLRRKDYPTTPKAMANALRRVATMLRRVGVDVTFAREPGGQRQRIITLGSRP